MCVCSNLNETSATQDHTNERDGDASASCAEEAIKLMTHTEERHAAESVVSDVDVGTGRHFGHQSSNSSLADRFVQPIDLPPLTSDDFLSNR